MKKFNLFVMAALSATYSLTSCSSDDEIDSEPMTVDQAVDESTSYLTVNLSLADMTSTRADGDYSYADGEASEYALDNAFIYIYQKDNDGKYRLDCKGELKAYAATDDNTSANSNKDLPNSNTTDHNTGYESRVAQLDGFKAEADKSYYVLVLANRPAACPDPEEYTYFEDWTNQLWNEYVALTDYQKHLFMANALLTSTSGDLSDAKILAEVKGSDFQTTQLLAEKADGVSVCIERSCAKLTVAENTGNEKYWADGGADLTTQSAYAGKVQLLDFGAHNYNTASFPVHTLYATNEDQTYGISELDEGRMTSAYFYNQVTTLDGNYYSINWSYTPRYNQHTMLKKSALEEITDADFWKNATASSKLSAWNATDKVVECYARPYEESNAKGLSGVVYVPENCQEFSGMHKGETTAVVLRGQWTPSKEGFNAGDDVYVCNGILYTEATLKQTILDACKEAGCEYTEDEDHQINLSGLNDLNIKNQSGVEALTKNEIGKATDDQLKAINAALNTSADGGILMYKGGICYYVVYPRHFSDTNANTNYQKNESSYKLADLGRYGLVRNHWYELTVTSIALPGTPYVPEVTTHDPDDNPENIDPDNDDPGKEDDGDDDIDEEVDNTGRYLSVSVRTMSWAKRTNSLTF